MTRINAGIPPAKLTNAHLLAEHREIKRVPNNVVKRLSARKQVALGPARFCLGKGHVNFFNDKLLYLHKRYELIRQECLSRGFNMQDYGGAFESAKQWAPHLYNDWRPRMADIQALLNRLREKDDPAYAGLSAQKIWRALMAAAISELKQSDPELYSHIKNMKP